MAGLSRASRLCLIACLRAHTWHAPRGCNNPGEEGQFGRTEQALGGLRATSDWILAGLQQQQQRRRLGRRRAQLQEVAQKRRCPPTPSLPMSSPAQATCVLPAVLFFLRRPLQGPWFERLSRVPDPDPEPHARWRRPRPQGKAQGCRAKAQGEGALSAPPSPP